MASCSSCSSASSCASAGHPGGEGCIESAMNKQDEMIARRLERIRHKIFVMSGKGGVGKSSVTVNVAAALAHRGFKVGIMDVDIHGPSVPNLLGLPSGIDMNEDNALVPSRYNGNLSVISMDSLLQDRNTAILWRGPKKTAAIRQFLSDVAWGDLDFLFIDSPPGTGDEHMTVLKLIPDALCVAVTHPAGDLAGRRAQGHQLPAPCRGQAARRGGEHERPGLPALPHGDRPVQEGRRQGAGRALRRPLPGRDPAGPGHRGVGGQGGCRWSSWIRRAPPRKPS